MRSVLFCALLGACCAMLLGGVSGRAEAGGRVLDGRMAPDMSFSAGGLNGVDAGTRLSAYRGRPVFIKFWLRDCPICRRTLPRLQALHDRWGERGLVVLSVIHKYRAPSVTPLMNQFGYDFPVAFDVDGSEARKYGVGRRPVDYLIGVDGRVRESNDVSDQTIAQELGKYRLLSVDPLPASLRTTRDAVWQGALGTALRLSERAAAEAGASADVKAAAERVARLAREYLDGGAAYAARLARRRQVSEARAEHVRLREAFRDTSLAKRAAELEAGFTRLYGKP